MEEATSKYKILIVDDSDFSRNSISNMLSENKRYQIVGEASNAKEAYVIVKDRRPHIAIVDVVMPEVSGLELAEKINQNFPDVSVIMISSLGHESVVIDSISMGASDFLQKPFKDTDLLNSIEKILSNFEEN